MSLFLPTKYQSRAVSRMQRGNVMLIWDPGVGKTWPVLASAALMDGPTLVIVPAHLRDQWKSEAQIHVPWLVTHIFPHTTIKADFYGIDIVIVSYEYASTLDRWKELRKWTWAAIAIDECHYLMNGDAARTHAILGAKPLTETHGLVNAATRAWYLSGTPFTFPSQTYPILAASFKSSLSRRNEPGFMNSREWENEHCVVAPGKGGFGEKIVGAKNIPELRARLAPAMDRVKLEEAVDMPRLTIDTVPVRGLLKDLTSHVTPELMADFEALQNTLLDADIPDELKLAALDDSGMVMAQLRHAIAVAKIGETQKIIENELASGTKKIIVFGWHKKPLTELASKVGAALITGDQSEGARKRAREKFTQDDKTRVLVGQISATGTGIDGLQKVCHRAIFMEASWTFRDNKQCIHRIYRNGQTLPVHASFVTLLGSVDEYVQRVLKRNAETVSLLLD